MILLAFLAPIFFNSDAFPCTSAECVAEWMRHQHDLENVKLRNEVTRIVCESARRSAESAVVEGDRAVEYLRAELDACKSNVPVHDETQLSDHDKIFRDWSRILTQAEKIVARVPEPSDNYPGRRAMIQDAADIVHLARKNRKREI